MGEQKEAVSNSNIFDVKSQKREKRMRVGCKGVHCLNKAGEEANPVTNH